MTRTLTILLLSLGLASPLRAQSDSVFIPSVSSTGLLAQNEQDRLQSTPPDSRLPPIVNVPPTSTASPDVTSSSESAGSEPTPAPETTTPPPLRRNVTRPDYNSFSMASIPNMIGDTTGGGCSSLSVSAQVNQIPGQNNFQGNSLSDLNIGHPAFGCSRLNIAENNSPVLHDRVYANYRHFHNTSQMEVYNTEPLGGSREFNTERLTIGAEKRVGQSSSIEIRLPLNYQMDSDILATRIGTAPNPPVATLPLGDFAYELGNLGLIYKCSLIERNCFYLSSGVGVNLPTAPDVNITSVIDDDAFPVGPGGATADVDMFLNTRFRNETVNITPFLAVVYRPTNDWFTQGFLQCDVPVNSSQNQIRRDLVIDGAPQPPLNVTSQVEQQTVLRLNTGIGRFLRRGRRDCVISSMAIMFEAHYATTLDDSNTTAVVIAPDRGSGPTVLNFGNFANRVDTVNLSMGLPMVVGNLNLNPGVAVPISTGANRAFDFEASIAIDQRF